MKNKMLLLLLASSLICSGKTFAQGDAAYTEGPVWELTMVRVKHGMVDAYLKSITHTFDATMRAAKKKGLILDYKVLIGNPGTASDFNVLLMVETRNMAAQDNVRERWGDIVRKAEGDAATRLKTDFEREHMRAVLGDKLMREITLQP